MKLCKFAACLLFLMGVATAHPLDEATLEVVVKETDQVTLRLRLPHPQLAEFDRNSDGRLDEEELKVSGIVEEFKGKVVVVGDKGEGSLRLLPAGPATSFTHTALGMQWTFPEEQDSFRVKFDYFVESKDNPRCLASFNILNQKTAFVFDRANTEREISTSGARFLAFAFLGAEHILTGYDHLLFLAVLLLAGGGVVDILKMVTAFTVAHSITLGLAVLEVFTLPSWFVEPVIILSIAVAAMANLRLDSAHNRWMVAAGFGLIHGMGFAGLLADMNLGGWSAFWPLVGFNIGVELGQGLVVLAVAPILLWAGQQSWTKRFTQIGSVSASVVAIVWFGQYLMGS